MFRFFDWRFALFLFVFLAGCSVPLQDRSVCGDGVCSPDEALSCEIDCGYLKQQVGAAGTDFGLSDVVNPELPLANVSIDFQPYNPVPNQSTNIEVMAFLPSSVSENSSLQKLIIDFGDGSSAERVCSGASCSGDNCSVCSASFVKSYSSQGRYLVVVRALASNGVFGLGSNFLEVSYADTTFSCNDVQPGAALVGLSENGEPVGVSQLQASGFLFSSFDSLGSKSSVSYKPNVLFGRDFSSAIDENRVSLIVQFNSSSILEKARELGFDLDEFVKRPEAKLYFDYLLREHDATLVALSKFFNGFEKKASLFNVFNGAIIEVDVGNFEEAIAEAERLGVVKKVYPNVKVQMDLADSVPYIKADQLWALKDASGNNLTGKGVRVSVIDSGVDYRHSYLGGCFGASCKVIGGYDVINNDNDPMDDAGHGTHVAGIIAANGRFFKGVAPDVKLLAYKVFDKGGRGTWGSILRGLDLSMDPNGDRDYSDRAHVINLSLGGPGNQDSPFSVAIDNFVDNGVVVVAAAGNYMPNGYPYMGSPGSSRKAITVGASINRDVATFSMNGPIFSDDHGEVLLKPDIVAPGVNICSTLARGITKVNTCRDHPMDRDYGVSSGTSMATPHISGLAAILKQAHPDWSPDDIKGAIVSSGVDTGLYSHFVQGNGVVDAVKALNAKVITDPVSLAFISLPPYETQVKNFKIKNIGDSSVGVKIVAPTLVYQSKIDHYNSAGYDSGFDTIAPLAVIDYRGDGFNVNFSTSKNTICLSPKSFDEISLSLPSITSLKSGYYTTALKLEVYSTCDFREKINETTMPIGLVKFNKLVLNFTPKSNQVGETFVRDLYFFTKDYYLPQRSLKLGPNENVKELFFVDGSYDVVYVKVWKDGPWYRINSGGAMYVVREIDASKTSNGIVTFNINENEVPLLQDNFESILRESNLEFYGKFLVFGKEITSFPEKPNLMFFSGFYDLHGCPSLKKVDYYFSVSDSSRNKWPAYFGYHAKDKGKSFYNAQNLLMAGAYVNDLRNITNLNLGSISNELKRQVSFFKPFKNEIENFVLFYFTQAIPSGIISVGIGGEIVGIGGEINPDIKKTLYYTHPMFGVSRISYDVSKDKKFDMAYGQTFTGSLYSNPGDFELLKPPIKASFVEDKLVELGPNLEPLTSLSILFEDSGNKPQLLNKPDWHRLLLNQIYGTYFGGINRISIKRPDNKIIVINNLNERTLRCIYITEGKSNICDEGKYEFTFEFSSVDDPYVIKAEAYYYRTNGWNLVENPAPIVSLSTSKNSGLVEGERISFEVSASDPNGSIAWVDFYDNGVKVGRVERSPYRFETTLTKGTHEIIAYAFDDFGAIGSSSVISLNVAERVSPPTEEKPSVSPSPQPNVPPSVSLVSPVDGVSFVAPARVVLGAVASDVDGRVVRVDFYSGSVLLGSDSVAPFEFVWDGVGVGSYVVSARAVDDRGGVGVSGSVSFSVVAPPNEIRPTVSPSPLPNVPPVISLTSPPNNIKQAAPFSFVAIANASDPDGTISKVEFYLNDSKVGEDTTSIDGWKFNFSNLRKGNYRVYAKAFDDKGASSVSNTINVVVLRQEFFRLQDLDLVSSNGNVVVKDKENGNEIVTLLGVSPSDSRLSSLAIRRSSEESPKEFYVVAEVPSGVRKSITLPKKVNSSNAVCVYDADVSGVFEESEKVLLEELTMSCTKIQCPSSGSVSCSVVDNKFVVSGLSHSFVIEDQITQPSQSPSPSVSPSVPAPSCNDGIQNQGELGVDCGGPCPACPSQPSSGNQSGGSSSSGGSSGSSGSGSSGSIGGGSGVGSGGFRVLINDFSVSPLEVLVPVDVVVSISHGLVGVRSFSIDVNVLKSGRSIFYTKGSSSQIQSGRVANVTFSDVWVPLEGGEYEVVVTLWNSDRTTKYDVKRKKIIVGPSTKKDEEPEVSPKPSVVPSDKPVVRPSIEETPSEAPQETTESKKDFFSSIDLPIVLFSVGLLVVLSVIGFAVYTMRK